MAMVIMSPLSELTDTDGFEMHSASQRAPATPSPPGPRVCQAPLCWVLGYPGVTARPSSTAEPAALLKSLFEGEGDGVQYGGSSDSLSDPFWCTANPPP